MRENSRIGQVHIYSRVIRPRAPYQYVPMSKTYSNLDKT